MKARLISAKKKNGTIYLRIAVLVDPAPPNFVNPEYEVPPIPLSVLTPLTAPQRRAYIVNVIKEMFNPPDAPSADIGGLVIGDESDI